MLNSEECIIPANFIILANKAKTGIIKRDKKFKNEREQKVEEIKKRQQRENIFKSIRDREEYLELEGKKFIYSNQQDAGDTAIEAFKTGAVAVVFIAEPGVGKTGTAQAVMIETATNPNDEEIIYSENIINCTGMSDNDWEIQFKNSVLPAFRENIFHRQNLLKQKDKLQMLQNGLIIVDECHIASGSKMTIAKILKETGILDINVLERRNIKIIDISATPDAVLHDYKKWGTKCVIIKIQPGPSYKGFKVMLKEERIIDAPNLEEEDNYYELLESLDERYKNTTKKYFIFRLLDIVKINMLEHICADLDWDCLNHNSVERVDEIDKLMSKPPIKHTIIFIKGFWRASKRISRQHIGATYESIPQKRDTSVTAQSLAARDCDNYEYSGDQLDPNLRPLHYCDKGAIEQYVKWFNNDCDFSTSSYNSSRLNSNGKGDVTSKETKVHPKIVGGINNPEPINVDEIEEEPKGILTLKLFDEIKSWFTKNPSYGKGPHRKQTDENGFYKCITQSDKEAKIRTTKEFEIYEKNKKWGFRGNTQRSKDKNKYRVYPVYDNESDVNSLKWWLIYY